MLSSRGIILKVVKYGETSIICDIYTEEIGIQSYIINGVRKKNAKYPASIFQPMYLIEIIAYDNPNKEINRIKEIQIELPYRSLPFNIQKSAIGLFVIEIIRKSITEREANIELFNFIHEFFLFLDTEEKKYSNSHIWFLIHLSTYLGFMPSGVYDEHTSFFDIQIGTFVSNRNSQTQLEESSSSIIFSLMHLSLQDSSQIKLTSRNRNKLIESLIKYYQYHIDGMKSIQSHHILGQIFA